MRFPSHCRRLRLHDGITLFEATIVLAVAAILVAAAAPATSRTLDRTRLTRAQADAKAITAGINNFLGEFTSFSPFTTNGLSTGATVGMLVGDGDIPRSVGAGGSALWADPVNVAAASPVDFLERHLITNRPGGTGAYTTSGTTPWRGSYLNGPIDPDPWGNRYAVNVLYLRSTTANDVIVLSCGPDEEIDTAFAVNGMVPGDDDIYAIVRRDLGRTTPQ
jgi:type II secretory pathway pseudopilin PulG